MSGVAAIVVTWNRLALLQGCLAALAAQTRRPETVWVIDNASSDGTADWLARRAAADPALRHVRLERNGGGAGGFHHGMRLAYAAGAQWLWLMDDDTEPEAACLAELLAAHDRFPPERRPEMLASRVLWDDGSLHPMNRIAVKQRRSHDDLWQAAANGCLSLRSATFVSLLVHRRTVERVGLPLAPYFVWNDDVEFTARAMREGFGVGVPASVARHRTASPYATADAPPARYRLHVRNQLWMLKGSRAWDGLERLQCLVMLAFGTLAWLWRRRSLAACWAVAAGLCSGLLHRAPQPEKPQA